MDTEISNYSYDEILNVLHLDRETVSQESAFDKTQEMVEKIKSSYELDNEIKNDCVGFFWQCYQKIIQVNRYEYTRPSLYPGALPKSIPEVVTVNTNTTEYIRGDVNPLKRETIKNTLVISNKQGRQKLSTDFTVTLTETLSNVISLKVASLEIVNFYYNISEHLKNNYFHIETFHRNIVTGEISNNYRKKIECPDGYYNLAKFLIIVEPIFNADDNLSMIELGYDELKGKTYFILKDEPPIPPPADTEYGFNLDFQSTVVVPYNNIGWYLGYKKTEYTFDRDYNKNATLNSLVGYNPDMIMDFTGSKFFLLEVVDFNNNSPQVVLYNTYYNSSDILAKVPNDVTMTAIIFDNSSDGVFKTRKYFGPVNLQKLHIRLLDEYGQSLAMNGADVCVTFEVESLDVPYKKMVN